MKSAAGGKSCPQTDGAGPEGVTVSLKRPDGTTSATETGPGGGYSFGNLTSGKRFVLIADDRHQPDVMAIART